MGASVSVKGYSFYVIGDDGTNVTLLYKSTINTPTTWGNAKSQASTFGSNLGGSGRLMTKAEAEGVAASYRKSNNTYWLANEYNGVAAWLVTGKDWEVYGNTNGTVTYGRKNGQDIGIRPVVVISKSKLSGFPKETYARC